MLVCKKTEEGIKIKDKCGSCTEATLYLSHVMLIKVYGVASDPGLTFTQSPTIDENDVPLTFTSALHGKIQIDLRLRILVYSE